MSSYEERFADLPWRKFRAACKAQHTRRLAAPWYIRQGNLSTYATTRPDNDVDVVWQRQAKRYAAWWLGERLGRADIEVLRVGRDDRPYAVVRYGDRTTSTVPLPEHVDPTLLAANAHAEVLTAAG